MNYCAQKKNAHAVPFLKLLPASAQQKKKKEKKWVVSTGVWV